MYLYSEGTGIKPEELLGNKRLGQPRRCSVGKCPDSARILADERDLFTRA